MKTIKYLMMALAALTAQCALAAIPVAVWDGFTGADGDLSKNGYTWTKSTNTTIADGVVTIGSDGGLTMTVPDSTMKSQRKCTIIMDVENIPEGDVCVCDVVVNGANVWLHSTGTQLRQRWGEDVRDFGTVDFDRATSHRVVLTFEGTRNVGTTTIIDGVQKMDNTGLLSSAGNVTDIKIGHAMDKFKASGMKVSKISLFDSKLSVADAAAYKFPSEIEHITLTGNVTTAEINTAISGLVNFDVTLDAGATVTITDDLTAKVKLVSSGDITFAAATQPAAATLAKFDVSGIAGAVKRSWSVGAMGFNFVSSRGAVTTAALETTTWDTCGEVASGSATMGDGLSTITWTSPNVYDDGVGTADAGTFIRGYLDDSSGVSITVNNVPFAKYDVIIYGTTDTGNVKLTAKTVNGTAYTFDANNAMVAKSGSEAWGNSRSSATAPTYGVNALRVANQTAPTLTITSGASSGNRGCVSAIQIIPVGEPICTVGATSFDTLAKAMAYAKGIATAESPASVTLTATTAEAVTIPENVILSTTKNVKYTGTISGNGTISYDGANSADDPGFTAGDGWTGTVVLKNTGAGAGVSNKLFANAGVLPRLGKSGSTVKMIDCAGYISDANGVSYPFALELENGSAGYGWKNVSGGSSNSRTFAELKGNGTLDVSTASGYECKEIIRFSTASEFSGTINVGNTAKGGSNPNGKRVVIGSENPADAFGIIHVSAGQSITLGAGNTWTANTVVINGTLKFTEDATTTNGRKERFNAGTLSGSGLIDLSETVADNDHQLRVLFKGTNHNFTGSIKTRNSTHFVFAAANATTTGMAFSDAGFICLEGSNAVFGPTATWTATGLYLGANTQLTAQGGTLNGRVFALTSTIVIGSYDKPAITVTGAFDCSNGNQRLTLVYPSEAPTADSVKLFAWGSKGGSINANTFQGTVPEGYYLSAEADGLYMKTAVVGPETMTIANKQEVTKLVIGDGGVETLAGAGGVKISDLQIKTGGTLVIDPIKTPVYALAKPTLEGTITLASAYDTCNLGKFTLITWRGASLGLDAAALKAKVVIGSSTDYTVEEIDPEGISGHKQLIVKIGNYDAEAKAIKVMPLGDSITEGTSQYSLFARPNYRLSLMAKLEANGYKAESCGYQNSCNYNSAGILAPVAHQWHCGMSGQECQTLSAAGWEDSIDVALDAAGYPDYVTFKIGTNDMKDGSFKADELFRSWTNVLWKIHRARPNAKIICGTVLTPDTKTQLAKTKDFNQKIKDFVTNGDFPKDHIFVADLFDACPRPNPQDAETIPSGDGTNFQDWLHPNWVGHDLTSSCWRDAIIEAEKTVITRVDETVVPNTNHGAVNNVPDNYRKGFVKIATITPTATWKLSQGIESIMTIEPGMANREFTKVGYYMELKRRNIGKVDYQGHVRFVWADMEAFGTKNLAAFGISSDMINHQEIVNGLHVYSNDTGIRKVDPTVTSAKGLIEFTQFGIGNGNANVPGGPKKKLGYSWNDVLNASGEYGCLQIHRVFDNSGAVKESWNDAEVLLAFNRWTGNSNNEIGIGSCAQKIAPLNSNQTIDYIGTAGIEKLSSTAYDTMSIEIWGQLPPVSVEIPAAPTGATVAVTVDGETVDATSGSIEAIPGELVQVIYSAAEGYFMTPVVTTFAAGDEATIKVPDESAIVKAVAKVDTDEGVYYAKTLQAAINYAYDGETVTLLSDTTETVSNGKKITLHLNAGATLTGKDWYTVYNYGTLTIEGEGTIKGVATSSNKIIALYNSNTMYITGGIIEAKDYDIYENQAVATVVTGGQFNLTPGPWLTNGYTATVTSDKRYFVVETISDVARIGETSYATLQAALDEVVEGQMIELVSPTSETTTFNKNFIVVIKNSCYNYGNVTGVEAIYERLAGQYTQAANYVILSKSMEDLVDYVTANDSKYTGGHGCFWVYNDWTLTKNVRIPARGGATQSIFTVNDEFVLDLNGFTLDQAPIVDKNGKSSGHGGYPTIVADRGKKVTIKDSSADQTGILCGWGWAINIYDDPKTCVTLESGTVTSHGGQHPKSATTEAYSTYRGRVIRIMGGKFVMNGGKITLDHLEEGHQIFGIITADTAVASTPMIEINGGYIECAKPEQLWDPKGDNPNCLIGGSKGPDSEVEITGGSFSIVPPKTYFAEGLDAVVDENGHFHVQQVIHEGDEVTIAVSDDGEKLAPAVPEEGSVEIIAPDETQVYVIDIANQEAPAALYQVVTKDADGGVVSTSKIGVIKVEEKATEKKTIAVAVPFTGATVENLLNTKLLNEGDELKAYSNGAYSMWSLDATGKWVSAKTVKAGGTETAPNAETTALKRGTAVWVTTAGQVVTLGTFDAEEDIATADESVNLLANPTMEAFEPAITAETVIGDQVVETGVDHVRYTVVEQGGAKTWRCSTTIRKNVDGEVIDSEKIETKVPSIRVGRGYWMMKKSQKTK